MKLLIVGMWLLYCLSSMAASLSRELVESVVNLNEQRLPLIPDKPHCVAATSNRLVKYFKQEGRNFCRNPYHYVCNYKSESLLVNNRLSYSSEKSLQKKIKNIFTSANIEKFKAHYRQIILQSPISARLKRLYLRRIDALRIYAGQVSENYMIQEYRQILCGPNHDLVNAAAFPFVKREGDKAVPRNNIDGGMVVCPMLIKKLVAQSDTAEQAWKKLSFVLGHEMGHLLYGRDIFWSKSGDAGEGYYCWKECLTSNKSQRLLIKSEGKYPGKYKWYNYFSVENRVNKRLAELGADLWGVELFSDGLNKGDPKSIKQLKEAFGILCGSSDEGVHPTAQYRISITLRNHPKIMQLFHCKKHLPPEDKSCQLEADENCRSSADDTLFPAYD